MKAKSYKELERDKSFKRRYLSKTIWWNSFTFVPPALVLFIGLAGILFLRENDKLISWFTIPYIVLFLLGAIWFKVAKKHVQDKELTDPNKFLVCASRLVDSRYGYHYFVVSFDEKRHDEAWIKKIGDDLSLDSFKEEDLKRAKKKPIKVENAEICHPIFLKAFQMNHVLKTNARDLDKGITPLLYVSENNIFVIRNKDLAGK